MSEPRFTPGPWGVYATDETGIFSIHNGSFIASCDVVAIDGKEIDGKHDKDCANARLVAAAPELYAALEEAMRLIKVFRGPAAWDKYNERSPEMKRLHAILRKARGET